MGRPPTREKDLKDGWYFEVRNKGSRSGIKIHRDSEAEMLHSVSEYQKNKDVAILGESKGGKFVNDIKPKRKSKAKAKKK